MNWINAFDIVFTGDRGLPAIIINNHNYLGFLADNINIITWVKTIIGYLIIFDTALVCLKNIPALLNGEANFFGYHDSGILEEGGK